MNKSTKFLTAASVLALGLAFVPSDSKADGKEKCFGVVKAGKNDCGAKDGSHSCAGQASADANPNEWVYVPAGLCDKLAGGSKG